MQLVRNELSSCRVRGVQHAVRPLGKYGSPVAPRWPAWVDLVQSVVRRVFIGVNQQTVAREKDARQGIHAFLDGDEPQLRVLSIENVYVAAHPALLDLHHQPPTAQRQ